MKKRAGLPALILTVAVVICLLAATGAWPRTLPAGPVAGGRAVSGAGDLEIVNDSHLIADASPMMPEASKALETLAGVCRPELLPVELRPVKETPPGSTAPAAGLKGSGPNGWYPLARPYEPVADPNLTYVRRYSMFDSGGNRHTLFSVAQRTDVSQAPDAPGAFRKDLEDYYYTMYSHGAWSAPVKLTTRAGLESNYLLECGLDEDDTFHLIFTKHSWWRDGTNYPAAGNPLAYQHSGENIFYMYKPANAAWSAPRQLTGNVGRYAVIGGSFEMRGGRLYGAWQTTLNKAPVPNSYTGLVAFTSGAGAEWEGVTGLESWDYTLGVGQRNPLYAPVIGLSDAGPEVSVTYSTLTPGAAFDAKGDIFALVRPASGLWSSVSKVTTAADNQLWIGLVPIYQQGANRFRLLSVKVSATVDGAHPPTGDYCFIDHDTAWRAPVDLTAAGPGKFGTLSDLKLDRQLAFTCTCEVVTLAWSGVEWVSQGEALTSAREVGGVVERVSILAYEAQRFIGMLDGYLDGGGGYFLSYSAYRDNGVLQWDYAVFFTGRPSSGGFAAPVALRAASDVTVDSLVLTGFPGDRRLVTWVDKKMAGAVPQNGAIYSRLYEAGSWGVAVEVSGVPGNTDLLHVQNDTMWFYGLYVDAAGETHCFFEKAHYNPGPGTFTNLNKYYRRTLNGSWGAVESISAQQVGGDLGRGSEDLNGRVFYESEPIDPATGKEVTYFSVQKDPNPPATTYYFAEGTTRQGFDEWLCLQNPGPDAANATITYMLETGETLTQSVSVGAHARVTVDVKLAVGTGHDVSARVSADRLIVAERPMYFNYKGWDGGHDAMGAVSPSNVWYFAEGTTRAGFDEYLTLQNPSDTAAVAHLTYMLDDGTTKSADLPVGAHSRATRKVVDDVGTERDVSVKIECHEAGLVAERPMYFDYKGWTGGHNALGGQSPENRWYFAEGTTRDGFDEYICIQNPTAVSSTVRMRFLKSDGTSVSHTIDVPATSRRTVKVNDVVGPGQDVSTVVDSSCAVLAERPMYFDYHSAWTGGHDAVGALWPKNAWYFAEGTTRSGFEEWLTLENPGPVAGTATISYMLETGEVIQRAVGVPAGTRVTVDVAAAVGQNRDVSVLIWSDVGVVAERPMYFLYHGMWTGGHDIVGL